MTVAITVTVIVPVITVRAMDMWRGFHWNSDGFTCGRLRGLVAVRRAMGCVSPIFRLKRGVCLTHYEVHGAQHVRQHMVGLNL